MQQAIKVSEGKGRRTEAVAQAPRARLFFVFLVEPALPGCNQTAWRLAAEEITSDGKEKILLQLQGEGCLGNGKHGNPDQSREFEGFS